MKTNLPKRIESVAEAKQFLTNLFINGESFHCEDDTHNIILKDGKMFTDKESKKLNSLINQCWSFYPMIDPCAFVLMLNDYTIKTIDVVAKEWFDKVYGNSYFSAVVTLNNALDSEIEFKIPFQYGYDHMHEQVTHEILRNCGLLKSEKFRTLQAICNEQGIKLFSRLVDGQLKSVVKAWGE